MKIVSASIQFSADYRQRTSEATMKDKFATQPFSQQTNEAPVAGAGVARSEQRSLLRSSSSRDTYSASLIRRQGDAAARQLTTRKAVHSALERFYAHSVRIREFQPTSPSSRPAASWSASGSYYEISSHQQLAFLARGEILTDDGRAIDFQFYAQASSDFLYQEARGTYAEKVTRRTDPLIIHLQGDINHLSSSVFRFDIDSDGEKENLTFAGSGSGFLVLDKNQDGKINNGSELFGPQSGNGFQDLAEHDEDGNGFIDAGDSVYGKLQVWTRDEHGNDRLTDLETAGIAAIGTQSGESPFSLRDHYHNDYGQVRRTGIFIHETGQVGAVQQIDLSEREPDKEAHLEQRFDRGEQRAALEAEAHEPDDSLNSAMARLEQETRAMLERQDDLASAGDDSEPKSLLARLVDTLEQATREQRAQREKQSKNKE
ncbi:MAG: hypothetical protein R3208_09370 [Ketobacteraceae bacterium]|nr:hypothetical protein [Ketobacteraceae bacterium]